MEKVVTNGLTVVNMKEIYKTTKWKAKGHSHGQTKESTKGNTNKIKNTDMANSHGQTVNIFSLFK